jgi:hypothetical protein
MSTAERKELAYLRRLWACKRATFQQMLRCMELERKVQL